MRIGDVLYFSPRFRFIERPTGLGLGNCIGSEMRY